MKKVVTIAGTKVFELQHQITTTNNTDGFGKPAGFGTEAYAVLTIIKLA